MARAPHRDHGPLVDKPRVAYLSRGRAPAENCASDHGPDHVPASASGPVAGSLRLNDRQDMSDIRKQSVEADKYQPVEDIKANCNRRWEQSLGSNRRSGRRDPAQPASRTRRCRAANWRQVPQAVIALRSSAERYAWELTISAKASTLEDRTPLRHTSSVAIWFWPRGSGNTWRRFAFRESRKHAPRQQGRAHSRQNATQHRVIRAQLDRALWQLSQCLAPCLQAPPVRAPVPYTAQATDGKCCWLPSTCRRFQG
jgi:hypothetical protein